MILIPECPGWWVRVGGGPREVGAVGDRLHAVDHDHGGGFAFDPLGFHAFFRSVDDRSDRNRAGGRGEVELGLGGAGAGAGEERKGHAGQGARWHQQAPPHGKARRLSRRYGRCGHLDRAGDPGVEKVGIRGLLGGRDGAGQPGFPAAVFLACRGVFRPGRHPCLDGGEFVALEFVVEPAGQQGVIGLRIHP